MTTYAIVRSALDEWKAARTLMADSIRSYLSSSSGLYALCTAPSRRSVEISTVEEALAVVESELGSLTSEEEALGDMRLSLYMMRDKLSKNSLAQINTLPPEILAYIFALSGPCCSGNDQHKFEFHDLSAVCTHWRNVSTNRPDLWTHIDIGPDTPVGLTELLLKRAKDSPIHMHVILREYRPALGVGANKIIDVLAQHIHRIRTLNIKSYGRFENYVRPILNLWLNRGNVDVTRSLVIQMLDSNELLSIGGRRNNSNTNQPENVGGVLRSLGTLCLQGVELNWSSCAYHGLVDLRLDFRDKTTSMSVLQAAEILTASPKLVVLKLAHLEIVRAKDWSQPAPIVMDHLAVLNLTRMGSCSLKLLLPLIIPRSASTEISLGILAHSEMQSEFETFLARSKVATLYCEDGDQSHHPSLWKPILYTAGHYNKIILSGVWMFDEPVSEASPPFHKSLSPSCSTVVILLGCGITFEGLKRLVNGHGIQELHLERCWATSGRLRGVKRIRNQLLKEYPRLRCSISDLDSTRRLPCRTMFVT